MVPSRSVALPQYTQLRVNCQVGAIMRTLSMLTSPCDNLQESPVLTVWHVSSISADSFVCKSQTHEEDALDTDIRPKSPIFKLERQEPQPSRSPLLWGDSPELCVEFKLGKVAILTTMNISNTDL